jgi:hypothetical protein
MDQKKHERNEYRGKKKLNERKKGANGQEKETQIRKKKKKQRISDR